MRRLGSVAMRECPECRRWIKDTDLVRHYRRKHPEKMVVKRPYKEGGE